MSTTQLEELLRRRRAGEEPEVPPGARHLSVEEALAYRDAGNVPDADDRSLRLVLHVSEEEAAQIAEKRASYEPDFHAAPSWRRAGSRAVNVVPLRTGSRGTTPEAWWEEPAMQEMEEEWAATGRVAGMAVPGEYRGFVFKTVRALQDAGLEVTADTVADSIARWLPEEGAETIRAALKKREP